MITADSINFIKSLETGNKELMRKVPKADVHNHAALGGDFKNWIKKEGLKLEEGAHSFPDFTDFQNLVDTIFTYPYGTPSNLQRKTRFLSLFNATFEAAASDGVTYIEPGYDAVLLDYWEMDIESMLLELGTQIKKWKDKIDIRPDIGIIRVFDMKEIERTIYPCIESEFFNAIDIFADERLGPPEDFRKIYRAARQAGMKLKAHAGELLDADFVRRSVEVLELDEVQHGISAAKSPGVMRFLADNRIRLNICPSSNIQLCQSESFITHPLRILMDNGVKTCINTDDTLIFGQHSSDEFFSLFGTGLYTAQELNRLRLNGFPEE